MKNLQRILSFKVVIIICVILGIILGALARSCRGGSSSKDDNQANKDAFFQYQKEKILRRHIIDSMSDCIYNEKIAGAEKKAADADSAKKVAQDSIKKYIRANQQLVRSYNAVWKDLIQYKDSTQITVPYEFVDDCSSCFTRLEKDSIIMYGYMEKVARADSAASVKERIHKARIDSLQKEKTEQQKIADGFIQQGTTPAPSTVTILLNAQTMSFNAYLPRYFGGGAAVLTNDRKLIGFNILPTRAGNYYLLNIATPLFTIKRKR